MPVNHWKGITLPGPGDDLLEAWVNAFDSAGVVFPAQSVAAAREILTRADAAGHPPTAARPAYIDVNGILYRADGSIANGRWILRPVNEAQAVEGSIGGSHQWALQSGQRVDTVTVDLGVRPYDRLVQANFIVWGEVIRGVIDAHLTIMMRNFAARFPTKEFGSTVTVTGMYVVPAGQNPAVRAGFTGAHGVGGTFNFTADKQYSGLMATATPRGMA